MLTKLKKCLVKSTPLILILVTGCFVIYFTLSLNAFVLGILFDRLPPEDRLSASNLSTETVRLNTDAFKSTRFLFSLDSFMTSILQALSSQNRSHLVSTLFKYIETPPGFTSSSNSSEANLFFSLCSNQSLHSTWIHKGMIPNSNSTSNDTNRVCFHLAKHTLSQYYKRKASRKSRKAIKDSLIVMSYQQPSTQQLEIWSSCIMNHSQVYWFSEVLANIGSKRLPNKYQHGIRVQYEKMDRSRLVKQLWQFEQLSDKSNDVFIDESLFIKKNDSRSAAATWLLIYMASARKNRLPFYFDTNQKACRQLKNLIVV